MKVRHAAFPKLRLYQQIIIIFVVIVLVPLLGISTIMYGINQKALKKELKKFTDYTAEALYKDFNTEMSWQNEQSQTMSKYVLKEYLRGEPLAESALDVFDISRNYEAVGIYSPAGQLQDAAYRNFPHLSPELRLPQELGKDLADKPFEVLYFSTGDPKESPYFLRTLNRVILPGKGKEPQEVIYIASLKRFPYLQNLVRSNTLYEGFYIVDNDGFIIAGPSESVQEKRHISPEDYEFFQKLKPGVTREFSTTRQTIYEGAPEDGDHEEDAPPLQKVFVKMPNIDWGIIIESPYHVRQKYVKRARDQSLILIAVCVGVVVLLSLVYVLGISRNFRQLIKGIKAMAGGNYFRRIRLITNLVTPYEIVFLTAEFNRMARKMAESWEKSHQLTQELMRKNAEEALLNQMSKALHGTLSLGRVSEITTQQLGQYMNASACMLVLNKDVRWIWSRDTETSYIQCNENAVYLWQKDSSQPFPKTEDVESFIQSLDFGRLLSTEKSEMGMVLEPLPSSQFSALMACPALYQDQHYGFLLLGMPVHESDTGPNRGFSDEQLRLINRVMDQVGVAINQTHQWETIQAANIKLSKLDELKSNLIDTVSHELRTPLTSIKGYTSRLLRYESNLDADTRLKSLKVVKQQADRLSRLVDDLLVIPDLESASLRVFPDHVNLVQLIEDSVQFIQAKGQRDILVELGEGTASVLADPDRLEQILLNLLDNAVKYSVPDTPIRVSTVSFSEQEQVEITVSNESENIPPTELSSLFEKFKRLDDSMIRTTRGSGLGLFITKGLVEAMGGEISLDYAKGLFHVKFTVPLYQEATAPMV